MKRPWHLLQPFRSGTFIYTHMKIMWVTRPAQYVCNQPNHSWNYRIRHVDYIQTWFNQTLEMIAISTGHTWFHTYSFETRYQPVYGSSQTVHLCIAQKWHQGLGSQHFIRYQRCLRRTTAPRQLISSVLYLLIKNSDTIWLWTNRRVDSFSMQSTTRRGRSRGSIDWTA